MDKLSEFVDYYSSVFGDFPGKDGEIKYWKELLDQLPEDQVRALVDRASELNGDSHIKPRLNIFRKALRDIFGSQRSAFQGGQCSICDNRGWMSTRMQEKNYAVPCLCDFGKYVESKTGIKFDEDKRKHIYEERLESYKQRSSSFVL